MFEGPLRALAILCSVFVVLGFGLFAFGEARSASEATAEEVAGREALRRPDPSPAQERDREAVHGGPREVVDDVNDVLLAPFAGLVDGAGTNEWVARAVPALIALVVYGFGLGFLARLPTGRG